MSVRTFLCACWLFWQSAGAATATGLESCADAEAEVRSVCVQRIFAEIGSAEERVDRIEPLVASRPEFAVEALDLIGQGVDATLQARALDLRGQALLAVGRTAEAARALRQALATDDGTSRMRWVAPEGRQIRSIALDPGNGRIERTARSLIAAGEIDEARELLARALSIGAAGWAADQWAELSGGSVPQLDPQYSVLEAQVWYRKLPPLEIELLDAGSFSFERHAGKVRVLDFWATWCVPCAEELPQLQALYEKRREGGLEVVAVNVAESAEVAIPYAEDLGLTMRLGKYDDTLDDLFHVDALPVLIVVDREGRVRGRWDAYKQGLEAEVDQLVGRLLDGVGEPPPTQLATVIRGGGLLRVEWSRRTRAAVGGVTIATTPGSRGRILAAIGGRAIWAYESDGLVGARWKGSSAAGRLLVGEIAKDGSKTLIGFRPGASKLVSFRIPDADQQTIELPAPALAVSYLPGQGVGEQLLIGSIDGLFRGDSAGGEFQKVPGVSGVLDLGRVRADGEAAIVALETSGRLRWMRHDLETVALSEETFPDGFRLIVRDATGVAVVVPPTVTAIVTGAFLGRGRRQAAAATADGQLLLVDLEDGTVPFRARWDGIEDLASGDLDGDGVDQLVVAERRRLVVLTSSPRTRDTTR